jgi:hypothetical protein
MANDLNLRFVLLASTVALGACNGTLQLPSLTTSPGGTSAGSSPTGTSSETSAPSSAGHTTSSSSSTAASKDAAKAKLEQVLFRQLYSERQAVGELERLGRISVRWLPRLGKSDAIRAKLGPRLTAELGAEVPVAEYQSEVDEVATAFRSAITKTMKNPAKPKTVAHDAAVEKAQNASIEKELARESHDVKIDKTVVEEPAWQLRKNDIGLVESRYKTTWTLISVPNESYCAAIIGDVYQVADTHSGGYESTLHADHRDTAFIVPCASF